MVARQRSGAVRFGQHLLFSGDRFITNVGAFLIPARVWSFRFPMKFEATAFLIGS